MTLESRFQEEKEAIEHNLKLMRSNEKDGMQRILLVESMKQIPEFYKKGSCAIANFYYHSETGKIEYFETGYHNNKRAEGLASGMFVVASPIPGRDRIVYYPHKEVSCSQARVVFHMCASRYNTESFPKPNQESREETKPAAFLKRISDYFRK